MGPVLSIFHGLGCPVLLGASRKRFIATLAADGRDGAGRMPGSVAVALIGCLFLAGLIAATFIDFEHFIIPDEITVGGIVAGVVLSFLVPALHGVASVPVSLKESLIGAVVGGFLFSLLGLAAGGLIGSIVTATVGAVVLLFLIGLIKKA